MSGIFYKAVAQAMLLYRPEMWVITPRMERALDSFQHRVVQRITRRQPPIRGDGSWEYSRLAEEMGKAGLKGIIKLVTMRQNMVAQYIATQPIMDLCEKATRRLGARVS